MGAAELAKQFRHLMKNPIPGISAAPTEDDPLRWRVKLTGPSGTPYHGGWFDVVLDFPSDFPHMMPKAKYLTPIWHPNVSSSGHICVDMVRNNTSGCAVECILMGLHMLLATPNPDSALNSTCAKQFKVDYERYRNKAADMTRAHAMH